MTLPRAAICAAAIVFPPVPRVNRDKLIDDHVARSGIERDHLFRPAVRRNGGDVCNSAYVQRNTPEFGIDVQQIIDERNERRSFAAGSHVARTEIGDDGYSELFRQHGTVPKLKRALLLVENGLPVRSNQVDRVQRNAAFAYGLCIKIRKQKVQA